MPYTLPLLRETRELTVLNDKALISILFRFWGFVGKGSKPPPGEACVCAGWRGGRGDIRFDPIHRCCLLRSVGRGCGESALWFSYCSPALLCPLSQRRGKPPFPPLHISLPGDSPASQLLRGTPANSHCSPGGLWVYNAPNTFLIILFLLSITSSLVAVYVYLSF